MHAKLSLFVVALLVSSCATAPKVDISKDPVAEQWGNAMQLYHALPVYPPSEDFQVGAIVAFSGCLEAPVESTSRTTQSQASADVFCPNQHGIVVDRDPSMVDELSKHYASLIVFSVPTGAAASNGTGPSNTPSVANGMTTQASCASGTSATCVESPAPTTTKLASDAHKEIKTKKTTAQPADGRSFVANTAPAPEEKPRSIFSPAGVPTTLPIAEFPAFTTYSAYDASASASLPTGLFNSMFGAKSSKSVVLSVRFADVSTYGIPASPALVKLYGYCGLLTDGPLVDERCFDDYLWKVYHSATRVNLRQPMVVGLVYRVYLARQINFSFSKDAKSGFSAQMQALLDKALADQKAKGSPASTPTATTKPAATIPQQPGDAMTSAQSLQEAQQAIPSVSSYAPAAGEPGFAVSFGGANGEVINVTETFERPVPIGYQAVVLNGITASDIH